jgi:hypothetical protein
MGEKEKEMQETAQDLKPKGFKSLAQLRRCDGLVANGTITKEVFERDLLASDIENIPWRLGPPKEEDGNEEFQREYRAATAARKAALLAAPQDGAEA